MKKWLSLLFSILFIHQMAFSQVSSGSNPTYTWLKTQNGADVNTPVGNLVFKSLVGNSRLNGATIRAISSAAPQPNFFPMDISFQTGLTGLEESMRIKSNGNIILPRGRLLVNTNQESGDHVALFNGSVIATEFWVKEYANWPDYVFTPTYHLMSLSEIDAYIKAYGHLPNMPSAAEIASGGFSLDQMLAKSIEKTEELTLHMIAMEKQHQEETAQLKAQIALLLERVEKLENQ